MRFLDAILTSQKTKELASTLVDHLERITDSENNGFKHIFHLYQTDPKAFKTATDHLNKNKADYSKEPHTFTLQSQIDLLQKGMDIRNALNDSVRQKGNAAFDTTDSVRFAMESNNLFRAVIETLPHSEEHQKTIRRIQMDIVCKSSMDGTHHINRQTIADMIGSASSPKENNPSQSVEDCVTLLAALYSNQQETKTKNEYCSVHYIADTMRDRQLNINQKTTMAAGMIVFLQKLSDTKNDLLEKVASLKEKNDPSFLPQIQEHISEIVVLQKYESKNNSPDIINRFLAGNKERTLATLQKLEPYISRKDDLIADVLSLHFAWNEDGCEESFALLMNPEKLDILNKDAIERFPKSKSLFFLGPLYGDIAKDLSITTDGLSQRQERAYNTQQAILADKATLDQFIEVYNGSRRENGKEEIDYDTLISAEESFAQDEVEIFSAWQNSILDAYKQECPPEHDIQDIATHFAREAVAILSYDGAYLDIEKQELVSQVLVAEKLYNQRLLSQSMKNNQPDICNAVVMGLKKTRELTRKDFGDNIIDAQDILNRNLDAVFKITEDKLMQIAATEPAYQTGHKKSGIIL